MLSWPFKEQIVVYILYMLHYVAKITEPCDILKYFQQIWTNINNFCLVDRIQRIVNESSVFWFFYSSFS